MKKKVKCLRCGECCYAFEVPEIKKHNHQRCPYFSRDIEGRGICDIYNNRPYSCRIFILPADESGNCALGNVLTEKNKIRRII